MSLRRTVCLLCVLLLTTRTPFADETGGDSQPKKPTGDTSAGEAANSAAPTSPEKHSDAANETAAEKDASKSERNIRFQFSGIPYADAVRRFADMAGKPLVGEVKIDGLLTFADEQAYTYDEALDTLNVILAMKGHVLVEAGRYLRLTTKDELPQLPLEILYGTKRTGDKRPGQLVTVVFRLKHLDANETAVAASKMLSGAGSVSPLQRGRGLVVTDALSTIQRIEELILELDVEQQGTRSLKTFRLVNSSGAVLGEMIQRTLGSETAPREARFVNNKWEVAPPDPELFVTVTYDEPTQTLVVFGPRDLLKLAEELVTRFEKEGGDEGELRVYTPRVLKAETLAPMIRQAVPGIAGESDSAAQASNKARLIVDAQSNRLIISARVGEQMQRIEEFLRVVDRHEREAKSDKDDDGDGGPQSRVLPIATASSAGVMEILRSATTERDRDGNVLQRLHVAFDAETKALIVSGSKHYVELAQRLVQQLNDAATSTSPRQMRYLDLTGKVAAADLPSTVTLLQQLVRQQLGTGAGDAGSVTMTPAPNRAGIIVTASSEHLTTVESTLAGLLETAPKREARSLRAIVLRHARVDDVMSTLQKLTDDAARDRWPVSPPSLVADSRGNRILVTGTMEQLEAVAKLTAELDHAPVRTSRTVRRVAVRSHRPSELKPLLDAFLRQEFSGRGAKHPLPEVFVDDVGRRLIVLAESDDHAPIEAMIGELDAKEVQVRTTRALDLKARRAAEILPLVKKLYDAQVGQGGDGRAPSLDASGDGKRLLVTGTDEEIQRIESIVRALDVAERPEIERQTRAIPVIAREVDAFRSLVEQLYTAQRRGQRPPPGGATTIVADPKSRRLLVTGAAEEIALVESIARQLDPHEGKSERPETRVYKIGTANATELVGLLEQTLNQDPARPAARVLADAPSNRLIITAPPSVLDTAAAVIEELDQKFDQQPRELRIVELDVGDADETAALVTQLHGERMRSLRGGRYQPRAKILGDRSTNRLILTAGSDEMKVLDEIVSQLNRVDRKEEDSRVFRLEHVRAEQIADVVATAMTTYDDRRRPVERVRVAPDAATNSLVISGKTSDLELVASVVQQLDRADSRGKVGVRVVEVDSDRAASVAAMAERVWGEQNRDAQGADALAVTSRGGRVVIAGPQNVLGPVASLVEEIGAQVTSAPRRLRMVKLENGLIAADALPLLKQSYDAETRGTANGDATFRVDAAGNRLLVIASDAEFEIIGEILATLGEGIRTAERKTRMFEFAGATELTRVAPLVRQLYEQELKGSAELGPPEAQFIEDSRGARLIVTASEPHLERVASIISRLDAEEGSSAQRRRETRTFSFTTDAELRQTQDLAQKLYAAELEGQRPPAGGEATFTVDAADRRLLVTGSSSELDRVEAIFAQLRRDAARDPRRTTKSLEVHAERVGDVLELLRTVYQAQLAGGDTPVGGPATIVADAKNRRLLVTGDDIELAKIEALLRQLDPADAERQGIGTRILRVRSVAAADVFGLVEKALNGDREVPLVRLQLDRESNSIVATGTESALKLTAEIVSELDDDPRSGPRELKVIELEVGDADSMTTTLKRLHEEALRSQFGLNYRSRASFIADAANNRVIVTAPRDEMEAIDRFAEQLNRVSRKQEDSVVIPLKHGQASRLAEIVLRAMTVYDRRNRPIERVRVAADDASNSLVVSGATADLEAVKAFIAELDSPLQRPPLSLRILRLARPHADQVASLVQRVASEHQASVGRDAVISVQPSADRRRVIVVAPKAEMEQIAGLVVEFDKASFDTPKELYVEELTHARAQEIAPLVQRAYDDQELGADHGAVIRADALLNRLLVLTHASQIDRVRQIIAKLDVTSDEDRETRFFRLRDVDELGQLHVLAERLYREEMKGNGPRNQADAQFIRDDTNVRLIVTARASHIEKIAEILDRLRTGSDRDPRQESQIFALADSSEVSRLLPLLQRLYRQEFEHQPGGASAEFIADAEAHRIIVSGPHAHLERVAELLSRLRAETAPDAERELQVVELDAADADSAVPLVLELLRDLMQNRRGPGYRVQARIVPDGASNRLLVTAPEHELAEIRKIAASLDAERDDPEPETRVYDLETAIASSLAETVRRLYEERSAARGAKRVGQVMILSDEATNRLVVTAPADEYTVIEEIIERLDAVSKRSAGTRIFKLKTADAQQLATILSSSLTRRVGNRQIPRVSIGADRKTNTLIISGEPDDLQAAALIVEEFEGMDSEAPALLRVYEVKEVDAGKLRSDLERLYRRQAENTPNLGTDALFHADSATNRLFIIATQEELVRIHELIGQLDVDQGPDTRQLRVFTVSRTSAASVSAILQQFFVERAQGSHAERVRVSASPDDRTIVVNAPAAILERIESLVTDLDGEGRSDQLVYRSYQLSDGDASILAPKLERLFAQELQTPTTEPQARFEADVTLNRLLVAARVDELPEIDRLVNELTSNAQLSSQVQTILLRESSATQVVSVLKELLATENKEPEGAQALRVSAAPALNAVVVHGLPQRMAFARELIKSLDRVPEGGKAVVQTVKLNSAEAVGLAAAVSQAIEARGLSDRTRRVRVTAEPNSNSILIDGPRDEVNEVIRIIRELDSSARGGGIDVRIYKLENGQVREVSATMRTMLDQIIQQQVQRNPGMPRPPFVVSVDERTETLIVYTTPRHFPIVEQLLTNLDKAPERSARTVHYVALENIDALRAVRQLEALYLNQSSGERPVIEADSLDNSLTIIAKTADLDAIIDLVEQLDAAAPSSEIQVRVVPLVQMPADQMASMLISLYSQMTESEVQLSERLPPRGGDGVSRATDGPTGAPPVSPRSSEPSVTNGADEATGGAKKKEAPEDTNTGRDGGSQGRGADTGRGESGAGSAAPGEPAAGTEKQSGDLAPPSDPARPGVTEAPLAPADSTADDRDPTSGDAPPTGARRGDDARQEEAETPSHAKVFLAVDKSANAILLSGPRLELDVIEELIEDLSFNFVTGDAEFRFFRIKHGNPTAIATALDNLFNSKTPRVIDPRGFVQLPPPVIQIATDRRLRSVIVRATPADFTLIESIIEQLDSEGAMSELRFRSFPLQHADLDEIFPTVQQLAEELQAENPGEPVRLAMDTRSGAIVIASRPQIILQFERLIQTIDRPSTYSAAEVLLVPLRQADAGAVAAVLQRMLQPSPGATATPAARALQEQVRQLRIRDSEGVPVLLDLSEPIKIMADSAAGQPGGNRLIITSTPGNLRALEAVVQLLDTVPIVDGVSVRLVKLKRADANTVSQIVRDVFQQGVRLGLGSAGPGQPESEAGRALTRPLNVSADRRTNTLVLSGHHAAVALALGLIDDMDQAGDLFLTEVKLFPLRYNSAQRLLPLLRSVFSESGATPGSEGVSTQVTRLRTTMPQLEPKTTEVAKARAPLTIQADGASNTLIVAARSDSMPLIADIIATLDIPAAARFENVRIFPLVNARARDLQQMLSDLVRTSTVSPADRPSISVDLRTNALVVAASEQGLVVIRRLVEELDREVVDGVEMVALPLKYNDALQVAASLRQLFNTRRRAVTLGGGQADPRDRVDVRADRFTNSLLVVGTSENIELVRQMLLDLDAEPTAEGGVLHIFVLQHADAQRAATMLRNLIRQGLYRPGATSGGAQATRERMAVTIDPRVNALIVSASPENLAIVKQLVGQIDREEFAGVAGVRLFKLNHASSARLAPILQQFFTARRTGEATVGDPERLVPVFFMADSRTNTLLVAGSQESFAAIERMVKKLDVPDVRSNEIFQVFHLRQSSATQLRDTLDKLFLNRPAVLGNVPVQPITIVVDTWANALIVRASVDDMEMVASLVERLDIELTSSGTKVQVISLEKANAQSVATTIRSLYASGGDSAPVAISVDERLNALVISAGETDQKRIEDLVQKLDSGSVANVSEIRVFTLEFADSVQVAALLSDVLTNAPINDLNTNRQTLLQFISQTEDGEELIASALQEGVVVLPDTRTNSLLVSTPVDSLPLLEQLVHRLDSSTPPLAAIKVFTLKNADARQMAELLLDIFRLREPGASAARSIRYSLDRRGGQDEGEPDAEGMQPFESADDLGVATIGSAEQASLTVTVDVRTNSILVGGSEQYVAFAGEIIEELDSSPARERRTQVYRLRNAQAESIQTALTSFLEQSRQRITEALGVEALGSAERQLEEEVAIVAEPVSNTLLLSASPRFFDEIYDMIEELDQPVPQVLIQVLLAEVTLDSTNDLGIEWITSGDIDGTPFESSTDFGVPQDLDTAGGLAASITGGDVRFLLRALQTDGRLEVLSRPQILATDNQQAEINIGQNVPQITGSQSTELGSVNNLVEYRNVGVILRVTPRISPDGFVKMDVEPEISSLSSSSVDFGTGVTAPIFNERSATTTVSVQNGHTIIIGGLISTSDDERERKVPILGDIPFLGAAFRSRKMEKRRTELLIILTPHVLVNVAEADRITDDNIQKSGIQGQEKRDEMQKALLDELYDLNRQRELEVNQPHDDVSPFVPGSEDEELRPLEPTPEGLDISPFVDA